MVAQDPLVPALQPTPSPAHPRSKNLHLSTQTLVPHCHVSQPAVTGSLGPQPSDQPSGGGATSDPGAALHGGSSASSSGGISGRGSSGGRGRKVVGSTWWAPLGHGLAQVLRRDSSDGRGGDGRAAALAHAPGAAQISARQSGLGAAAHVEAAGCSSHSRSSRGGFGAGLFWGDRSTPMAAILKQPLPVYHSRLLREDKAALVRLRWYSSSGDAAKDGPEVSQHSLAFLERKLHREAWTGEFSVKERAPMYMPHLPAFLSGQPVPGMEAATFSASKEGGSSSARRATLLKEVQHFLHTLKQEPVLRTRYKRSAFQKSNTNEVRISLDTQVTITREHLHQLLAQPSGLDNHTETDPLIQTSSSGSSSSSGRSSGKCSSSGPECKGYGSILAKAGGSARPPSTVCFPYAILEIKLADGDSCPDWVMELRNSDLVVEVPKFSKFLHGAALLLPSLVRNTPPWFLPAMATLPPKAAPASGRRWWKFGGSHTQPASNGGANGRAVAMTPATIEEVSMPWDPFNQGTPSRWFPDEISMEQWHDVRATQALPHQQLLLQAKHSYGGPQTLAAGAAVHELAQQQQQQQQQQQPSSTCANKDGPFAACQQHHGSSLTVQGEERVSTPTTAPFLPSNLRIRVPSSPSPISWATAAPTGFSASTPPVTPRTSQDQTSSAASRPDAPEILPPSPIRSLQAHGRAQGGAQGSRHTAGQLADLQGGNPVAAGDQLMFQLPALGRGHRVWSSGSLGSYASSGLNWSRGSWDAEDKEEEEDEGLAGATPRLPAIPAAEAITMAAISVLPDNAPQAQQAAGGQQQQQQQQQQKQQIWGKRDEDALTSAVVLAPDAAAAPSRQLRCNGRVDALPGQPMLSMQSIYSSSDGLGARSSTGSPEGSKLLPRAAPPAPGLPLVSHQRHGSSNSTSGSSSSTSSSSQWHQKQLSMAAARGASGSTWLPQASFPHLHTRGSGEVYAGVGDQGAAADVAMCSQAVAAPGGTAAASGVPPMVAATALPISSIPDGGDMGGACVKVCSSDNGGGEGTGGDEGRHADGSEGRGRIMDLPNGDSAYAALGATPSAGGVAVGRGVKAALGRKVLKALGGGSRGWACRGSGDNGLEGGRGGGWKGAGRSKGLAGWGLWRKGAQAGKVQRGGVDVEAPGLELPRAAAMVRSRIEPKTFFAAERTFLSWLNVAVLLTFVALSLMVAASTMVGVVDGPAVVGSGTGTVAGAATPTSLPAGAPTPASGMAACKQHGACMAGLVAGLVIAPVAMLLMAYSLWMYRTRTGQILRRETVRYDDQRGPVALVVILIMVLAVAYALSITAATATRV